MPIETHNRVIYEDDPVHHEEHREEVRREGIYGKGGSELIERATAGGTAFAATAGLAAVVLSVLGLVSVAPSYMAAIAAIVVGGALLMESGFTSAWFAQEGIAETRHAGAQLIGGLAGIVLGILALVGVNSDVLLSAAALALGASILMPTLGGTISSGKAFIGLGALVLGILALVGYVPMTLNLVAFLALGCAAFLSSTAFSAKLISTTKHP